MYHSALGAASCTGGGASATLRACSWRFFCPIPGRRVHCRRAAGRRPAAWPPLPPHAGAPRRVAVHPHAPGVDAGPPRATCPVPSCAGTPFQIAPGGTARPRAASRWSAVWLTRGNDYFTAGIANSTTSACEVAQANRDPRVHWRGAWLKADRTRRPSACPYPQA